MKWSDNCALILADSITDPVNGRGIGWEHINIPALRRAADVCDEQVASATEGTIKRYTFNGTVDLSDEPASVQQAMLDSMAGDIYIDAAGLIVIEAGERPEAVMTIPASDLTLVTVTEGDDATTRYNAITATYTSPPHGWVTVEAAQERDEDDIARLGRERIESKSFPAVTSHNQVRRLSRIAMAEENPRQTMEISGSYALIEFTEERYLRVDSPEDGVSPDTLWRVVKWAEMDGLTGFTFSLAEVDPTAWDFDPGLDEGLPQPVPASTVDPALIPDAPENLVITFGTASDGVFKARIVWQRLVTSHVGEVRFREPAGANTGVAATVVNGMFVATTPVLVPGTTYEFEARVVRNGVQSPWSTFISLVAANQSIGAMVAPSFSEFAFTPRDLPSATQSTPNSPGGASAGWVRSFCAHNLVTAWTAYTPPPEPEIPPPPDPSPGGDG